jgi:hypothetical protein
MRFMAFTFFFLLCVVESTYVTLDGRFETSNGDSVSQIHIATQVTSCTRDVMIRYRQSRDSGLVQAFLTPSLTIVARSAKAQCPMFTTIFIWHPDFTIRRIGFYVMVTKSTSTTIRSTQPSTSTTITIIAPELLSTSTTSPACQRRTSIDLATLFDEANDYVLAGLSVFATTAVYSIRGLLMIVVRAIISAIKMSRAARDEEGQDEQRTTTSTSDNSNNNNPGSLGVSAPVSCNNDNGVRNIMSNGACGTVSSNNGYDYIPRSSSLTVINENEQLHNKDERLLRPQISTQYGNVTFDISSSTRLESPPPQYFGSSSSSSSTARTGAIFCRCSTGSCVDCKCVKAGVGCNLMCHKTTAIICRNPNNKK